MFKLKVSGKDSRIFSIIQHFPAREWCVMDTVFQKQEPHTRSMGSFEVVCFANLKIHEH